jgi:hypothetical protein
LAALWYREKKVTKLGNLFDAVAAICSVADLNPEQRIGARFLSNVFEVTL